MPQLKVQNFYSTTITSDIIGLGDTSFTVAVPPTYTTGYLVLSPSNAALREIVFFHNVVGSTVSVRAENRGQGGTTAKLHTNGEAIAMKDVGEIFNFFSDSLSQCFFVEKTGGLTIKVWGGTVFYNGNPVTVADTNITLTDNQINYIKYSYPTNTISADLVNSGNIKAKVTVASGVITVIQYYVAKESYIDFTVTITGALPDQTGNAGKALVTDGTNISWQEVLPSQIGNAGKFLGTDGINDSWQNITSSNLKNFDFIAGEALSTGNAVVIEKLDTQDPAIFQYSFGGGTTSTSVAAGAGSSQPQNSYYGMRFSISTQYAFSGGTIHAANTSNAWRLLDGSNSVIGSGSITGTTMNVSAPILLSTGVQYKLETTNTGSSSTYSANGTTLPIVSGITSFNYGTINGADTWSNQVTNIYTISFTQVIQSTVGKYIGDITANTRVEHTVWGTGISGNTMDIQIAKILNPANLGVRIETDNGSGSPSGTIAHPNATVSIVNTGIPVMPGSLQYPPGTPSTYTVTFPGNFTLTLNTKYHIVYFVGTYGSETINATNYYITSFTSIASTQKSKKWNGSAWSNDGSIRKWSSSTLFKTGVLAKTVSSAFTYCDGIVESAFNEGQIVTMVTLGETIALSGLTPRTKYYVSNTPGVLTTSAGGIAVGTAKTSGLFNIGGYNIT